LKQKRRDGKDPGAGPKSLPKPWGGVVFIHEFATSSEKEFAGLYAELRQARNFFRLLGRYLKASWEGHPQ
jgi:hypothetical protein